MSRLLDFYLATASAVYAIERPGERVLDHLSPVDYSGLTFTDRDKALDWLFTEASALLAAVSRQVAKAC
ncbi:AfsR family transcriptional regulator OS=Streptomyces alboniger OX=132473 GN=CP975_15065 PE=3 SV=1 [Streptomyces alboniger]